MKIKDIPWFDRPGRRLTRDGVETLSTVELLEILIGKGKKESVVDLSNRLISKYNLNKLGNLSINQLTKECKGDYVTALKILSFIELSKRHSRLVKGGYNHKPISCAKDVYGRFVDRLKDYKEEHLFVLLLDTKNKVINENNFEVSKGTLNSSLIHPREVFKEAIKASANSIILVHNHPSGNPEPSKEDLEVTGRLSKLGEELGIKVLDHVIVGNGYWSYAKNKG
mgnify:CR=1 FL=1